MDENYHESFSYHETPFSQNSMCHEDFCASFFVLATVAVLLKAYFLHHTLCRLLRSK